MATTSTNLSLRKPEGADFVSVALDISGNFETIDAKWAAVTPEAIGTAAAAGSNLTVARSNHVHHVGSGSAATPGLPIGEANSGFYRIGAGSIGATILGSLAWAFNAAGIVLETALATKHIATPAAPAAGYLKTYAKSDNLLYTQTPAGAEKALVDDSSTQTLSGKTYATPTMTGVSSFPAGASAAAPSIQVGTANAGIYASSAGVLDLTAGGAGKARLSSTGLRLGTIGAPANIFDLADAASNLSGTLSGSVTSYFSARVYAGAWSAANEGRYYTGGVRDFVRSTFLGAVEIPSNAKYNNLDTGGLDGTLWAGVVGMARTAAAGSSGNTHPVVGVGVYGQGEVIAAGGAAWGGNFVAFDNAGFGSLSLLWGMEVSCNTFSATTRALGQTIVASFATALDTDAVDLNGGPTGKGPHALIVGHVSAGWDGVAWPAAANVAEWQTIYSSGDGAGPYFALVGTREVPANGNSISSVYAMRGRTTTTISLGQMWAGIDGHVALYGGDASNTVMFYEGALPASTNVPWSPSTPPTAIAQINKFGIYTLGTTTFIGTQLASAPSTPSAGLSRLYSRTSDGKFRELLPSGVESLLLDSSLFTAAGQIIYGTGNNAGGTLAAGTATQVLHGGTTPSWSSVATGDIAANAVTQRGTATATSGITTASGTFVDMTDMSVTLTTTGGDLMAWFSGVVRNQSAAGVNAVGFRLDSTDTSDLMAFTATAANDFGSHTCVFLWTGVSAASHTVKVRWRVNSGTAEAFGRTLIVMELKK